MKRIVLFHLVAILFSLLNIGCAATAAPVPQPAMHDLLLTDGVARTDLAEIGTDVQPWIVVKLTLNTKGPGASRGGDHFTWADAEFIQGLDNSPHRIAPKTWTVVLRNPAADQIGVTSPLDLGQQRNGIYLCKLTSLNEIEVPSLRMIPDDWVDKLKPALAYQAANPSIMRVDNVFKPETLSAMLDDANPFLAMQAWRILCTGEPSKEIITYRFSKTRGVTQGASMAILANTTVGRQFDFRHGLRPAIESARTADDVYGLSLGCWALPPSIYTDDIATKILAKPTLIDSATNAGRTNRAVLEHLRALPASSKMNARAPAS